MTRREVNKTKSAQFKISSGNQIPAKDEIKITSYQKSKALNTRLKRFERVKRDCKGIKYIDPSVFGILRWFEIVFIFPRLVLQILFQIQFGLSYQCEISHRHK